MRFSSLLFFGLTQDDETLAGDPLGPWVPFRLSPEAEAKQDREFLEAQTRVFLQELPELKQPSAEMNSEYFSHILAHFGFNIQSFVLYRLAPLFGKSGIPVFTRPNFVGVDMAHHQDGVTVRKWGAMCGELSAKIFDKKSNKTFLISVMLSQTSVDSLSARNDECKEPSDPSKYTTAKLESSNFGKIESIEDETTRLDAWIRYLVQIAKYRNHRSSDSESGSFWSAYATSVPIDFFYFHYPLMVAVTVMTPAAGDSDGFKNGDNSRYVPGFRA